MNKSKLLFISSILLLALASCRPVYRPTSEEPSSVSPSSQGSSGAISSYSYKPDPYHSRTSSSYVPSSSTPSSQRPSSSTPSSQIPSSSTPSSQAPSSQTPSSQAPSSQTPSSQAPSSQAPSSQAPSSQAPSSQAPSSQVPSSSTPSSQVPSSSAPSSQAPSSQVPSSVTPSSLVPSSQVPSSQAPSSSGGSSSSSEGPHEHDYKFVEFISNPNYLTYRKGYNHYECSCGATKDEEVYYTKYEMCDLMNEYIANKSYFDLFEVKEELRGASNPFPVVDDLTDTEYFGYDTSLNKVAVFNNDNVVYPSGATYSNFVSFREITANSYSKVKDAITTISSGSKSYSGIKLTANINISSVSSVINLVGKYPIHLDLDGHTITNKLDTGPAIKLTKYGGSLATVAITNGTITTKEISGDDMTKSPTCITNYDSNSLRISNMNLINNAQRGYPYIDSTSATGAMNVKLNNNTFTSAIVALNVQKGNYIIEHNTFTGASVFNGGNSVVRNNTFDATNVQKGQDNEATELVDCLSLYNAAYNLYVTLGLDKYLTSSTDAVLIFDRRSTQSTFTSPNVSLDYNILKCKLGSNNAPFGYGIRYMDLNLDPNKPDHNEDGVVIGNHNTYSYLQGGNPLNNPGGYIFYHHN